jgi:hypothetical protein
MALEEDDFNEVLLEENNIQIVDLDSKDTVKALIIEEGGKLRTLLEELIEVHTAISPQITPEEVRIRSLKDPTKSGFFADDVARLQRRRLSSYIK